MAYQALPSTTRLWTSNFSKFTTIQVKMVAAIMTTNNQMDKNSTLWMSQGPQIANPHTEAERRIIMEAIGTK